MIGARDAPIIRSAIRSTGSVAMYICVSNLYIIADPSLLVIKFLGGQLVAKKPYFMQTLRLTDETDVGYL